MHLISLQQACPSSTLGRLGGKGLGLYRLATAGFAVPSTWVLPAEVFTEFLEAAGLAQSSNVYEMGPLPNPLVVQRLRALRESIRQCPWPPGLQNALLEAIREVTERVRFPLVVRSSAEMEDGASESKAGLYQSCLGLTNAAEVLQAIRQCWASYFNEQAFYGNARSAATPPAMALLIQPQMRGTWHGVMFTRNPFQASLDPVIEAHDSNIEGIVSGRPPSWRYTGDELPIEASASLAVEQLTDLIPQLENLFGGPVDVEWVFLEGQVYLLQARPLTGTTVTASGPFRLVDAYDISQLPPLDYGDFKPLIERWLAKKYGFRRRAKRLGCAVPKVYFLITNRRFMKEHSPAEIAAKIGPEPYVVSFHMGSRFNIAESANLSELVLAGTHHVSDDDDVTVGLHELVRTEIGIISGVDRDGHVYIEYGPVEAHLLGTHAIPSRLTVDTTGQVLWHEYVAGQSGLRWLEGSWRPVPDAGYKLPDTVIRDIARLTPVMNEDYPGARIEWSLAEGTLYVQDVSLERGYLPRQEHGSINLSPGSTDGEAFIISAEELRELEVLGHIMDFSLTSAPSLEEIESVPIVTRLVHRLNGIAAPIVVADRPIRELAVLNPLVRGYLFRQGSLLCHLGILLREANIPALIAGEAISDLSDQTPVAISPVGVTQLNRKG